MKFTLLAIVLMGGLAAGFWVVDRFIVPPVETGLFVRDLAMLDREALCRASDVPEGALRLEAEHVVFADQTCEIVYRRAEDLPMEKGSAVPFTTLGYRCAGASPGPEQTSGMLVLMSGRLQMTRYTVAEHDLRGYVPAYAQFRICEADP